MSTENRAGWAIMGTATIAAEDMVTAIRAADHVPLWVVSRSKQDAMQFAEDLSIPRATTNLKGVLDDEAVGYAYINASVERREYYISKCAAAGKHMLCDGPIAHDSRTAESLVRICEAAGVSLVVNQPFRASPIHRMMRRLIEAGDVGAVQSVVLVRGGPPSDTRVSRRLATGDGQTRSVDQSVDDVDLVRFLTGAEPVAVAASSAQGGDKEEHRAYILEMSDGSLFQAHESFRTADIDSTLMVAGDKGVLTASGTLNFRVSGTLMRRSGGRNEPVPVRDREQLVLTVQNFLARVHSRSSWLPGAEENLHALRTAELIAKECRRRRLEVPQLELGSAG